jgi:pyruvate,water dikinase
MNYIKWFDTLTMNDVSLVGGKNASLGEMIKQLSKKGIRIPYGFAVTAEAYWHFLNQNNILPTMQKSMTQLTDRNDLAMLKKVGSEIRALITTATMPHDLALEIEQAYKNLCAMYEQQEVDVAVRSSATAEDLPEASFAGQQDTFLNIQGVEELLGACKKSMASLFTDRAIIYRLEKGFDHFKIGLSVGVQKMVRADIASAGVAFTLETESGFKDMVMINASWGLGEAVVKGMINPDEFCIHKTTLQKGFKPIIKKRLGDKPLKLIYGQDKQNPVQEVTVGNEHYVSFSLTDDEILELARYCMIIEDHYSAINNKWMPMDIEWAKDGLDKKLYIVQARPETIHASQYDPNVLLTYRISNASVDELAKKTIITGQSIGERIAKGNAKVAQNIADITAFKEGDILVTSMTDPDWVPIMKKAAAIITDRGGRTSHAAIVSRELGIPAIVGSERATALIADGTSITVDCSRGATGYVYEGAFAIETIKTDLKKIPQVSVELMVNIADPDQAFRVSFLPVDGVGLARTEFIISNLIKMHPMAAADPEKITDPDLLRDLHKIGLGYADLKTFFVDTLAQGIGSIAAAFYPRPVIVRFSDFKSNEYRNLLAGKYFEPEEENPMLGLRGASRYYSKLYEPAFLLECAALKKAREEMGFTNIKIMIPFIRTVQEAQKVIGIMNKQGLIAGQQGLGLYMMCEIPSNVVLIDEFCKYFDGISIGSNDLTQLALGVDRDSELLAPLFDERDLAVKKMMKEAIEGANRNKIHSGICGQAPSDYPEIGEFLIKAGIGSISLNPDVVLTFLTTLGK